MTEKTYQEWVQLVRLLDVFLLGPLMIYAGVKSKDLPPLAKSGLVIFGLCTIAFNGSQWLKIEGQKTS